MIWQRKEWLTTHKRKYVAQRDNRTCCFVSFPLVEFSWLVEYSICRSIGKEYNECRTDIYVSDFWDYVKWIIGHNRQYKYQSWFTREIEGNHKWILLAMILIHTKKYLQFYFIENLSNSFSRLIPIKFDSFHQFLKFYFNSLSKKLLVINKTRSVLVQIIKRKHRKKI